MKIVIVLFALAAAAYAQGDRVHVVDNADQVQVVEQPGGNNGVDPGFYQPSQDNQITQNINDVSQLRNDTQLGEINPNTTSQYEIQTSEVYVKPQTTTDPSKFESATIPDSYFVRLYGKNQAIDASNYMSFDEAAMPVVIPNPDPSFYQPHAPSNGYEPISTGPTYVDNGEVRPSLPYPYKQFPNGARGGK